MHNEITQVRCKRRWCTSVKMYTNEGG